MPIYKVFLDHIHTHAFDLTTNCRGWDQKLNFCLTEKGKNTTRRKQAGRPFLQLPPLFRAATPFLRANQRLRGILKRESHCLASLSAERCLRDGEREDQGSDYERCSLPHVSGPPRLRCHGKRSGARQSEGGDGGRPSSTALRCEGAEQIFDPVLRQFARVQMSTKQTPRCSFSSKEVKQSLTELRLPFLKIEACLLGT